jgi:hypothetical protein
MMDLHEDLCRTSSIGVSCLHHQESTKPTIIWVEIPFFKNYFFQCEMSQRSQSQDKTHKHKKRDAKNTKLHIYQLQIFLHDAFFCTLYCNLDTPDEWYGKLKEESILYKWDHHLFMKQCILDGNKNPNVILSNAILGISLYVKCLSLRPIQEMISGYFFEGLG